MDGSYQIWKKSTDPSSVHKELSYGEKIAKIGPVYPEILDKICQFFLVVLYLTFTNDLVAMATSLEILENMVQIHHAYVQSFHMVKRMRKSVQYIWRYSTKYAKPREHATPFPFVSSFSAETTGPIYTKILHVIVAFVVLLHFAYTRPYPIPFPSGIATK